MYLTEMTLSELQALLDTLGEPRYRAGQVFSWLSRGVRPESMTNLSKALREKLAALPYGAVEVFEKRLSQRDGTSKYLFRL